MACLLLFGSQFPIRLAAALARTRRASFLSRLAVSLLFFSILGTSLVLAILAISGVLPFGLFLARRTLGSTSVGSSWRSFLLGNRWPSLQVIFDGLRVGIMLGAGARREGKSVNLLLLDAFGCTLGKAGL